MRISKIIGFIALIICFSCKEKKSEPVEQTTTTTTTTTTTAQAVKHYICANNCENSGGDAAGICPTCNTPYTHNQAFHSSEFLQKPLDIPQFDASKNSPAKPATASPAQNKYGAFHYTCTNGCNGGSGSATACSTCGTQLVHNQAYHAK